MVTRSSLELMLDKLQQLEQRHADIPPPLPVRPVSRARPPRPKQFLKKECGNLKEREKGICKIQKWYRGHRVRRCYWELRRGAIALQSFIRGENARWRRCTILSAVIIIQKQRRKYLDQIKRQSDTKDQTRVPYASLVDLQKRVVRTEAKLRAKKEENAALKRKLLEIEKKWQQREERMASMEKEWQDELTYIQECLAAAAKKNPSPAPEKGERLHIPMKWNNNEELRKVRLRFKEWKKEYKNTLKRLGIGNTQTSKRWWGTGRLSN